MSEDYDHSIIRFYKQDGSPSGTGFAISEKHVISCTHVISGALGFVDNQSIPKDTSLEAEITLDGKKKIMLSVIVSFSSVENHSPDEIEDITVLELQNAQTVKSLKFASVRNCTDHQGQAFNLFGFNKPEGAWHDGVCKGSVGTGWIQLEVHNISGDNLKGLSGAPVWNNELKATVGMLVAKDWSNNLTAYMFPVRKLMQAWPSLQENTQKTRFSGKLDNVFMQQVKINIADELNIEDVSQFSNLLREELIQFLKDTGLEKALTDNEDVAEALIANLKSGGSTAPVITRVMMNATLHCLDKRKGKLYKATQGKHEVIKGVAEQILGWLILVSVKQEYLDTLNPTEASVGLYFKLPIKTPGGAEIIVARYKERQANFQFGDSLSGKHMRHVPPGANWKKSSVVNELRLILWNQVFPGMCKSKGAMLLPNEVVDLNAEIATRSADTFNTEDHILAIECQESNFDREVHKELFRDLPNLTLVCFGYGGKEFFYALEPFLISAVNRFLTQINKALNQ